MYQNTEYGYLPLSEDQTSTLVSSYKTEIGARADIVDESLVEEIPEETVTVIKEIEYLYDYNSLRNITRVRKVENGVTSTLYSYVYDEAEQIVRENNFELGKTYVYVYDIGGNIVQKIEYAVTEETLGTPLSTINYGYDSVWKDKLVSYNGTAITSDAMGNPLNAVSLNAIGGLENLELEWNGRQLSAVTRNTQRYEYSYDSNGMRTEIREYKNGSLETVCHYAWQNGKLVGLDIRDGSGEVRYVVKMIYDDAGESTGYIIFDEENSKQDVMHFQKNLQGDITGVFCESYGSEVLTYKYDAWGNITPQVTGGGLSMLYWGEIALLLTPITYRGYMYDPYIGMYYLQSRYYNPAYGRFLNADAIIKTGKSLGANIFAYCENNPVKYVDPSGNSAISNSEQIKEFIVVLVAIYVVTYNLFNGVEFNKVSNLKRDFNGIYKIDLRYSKTSNENEWLTIEFGDFLAWRNSSTYYNNNTSVHFAPHFEHIMEESANMGIGQDSDAPSVLFADAVCAIEIVIFNIQYSPYKKIYETVWGVEGLDPKNKNLFYAYRITGDKKYNGAYACSFKTGEWKELAV